jgi:hypothetical protein
MKPQHTHVLTASAVAAAGLFALAACTTEYLPQPINEPPAISRQDVGQLVTLAVCEHEQQCGRIGPDQAFASVEACAVATRDDTADAVDAEDCQDGAWASRVAACQQAISRASCDAQVDPSLLAACNEDLLCLQPRNGGTPPGTTPTDDLDGMYRRGVN